MNTLHTKSLRSLPLNGMLIIAVVIWLAFSSMTGWAQETQRGTASHGSFALSDIETINQTNGNLMFNFPLAALPAGRKGMSAGVGLYYNSKLYDPYTDNVCAYDPNTNEWDCALAQQVYPSPQGGWRYGVQYKLQQAWSGSNCAEPTCTFLYNIFMSFPDGSTHTFAPYGYPGVNGYYRIGPDGYGRDNYGNFTLLTTGTMTYYSTDGSYLRLDVLHDFANDGFENNPWILSKPDGGKVKFNEPGASGLRIYDSNNNYIEVQNIILPNGNPANKVIDQFNRNITVEHAYAYPSSTTYIRSTGANGQTLTWTIPEINNLGGIEYYSQAANGSTYLLQMGSISGVDQIISPSQAGGYAYKFDYTNPYNGDGFYEVKSVTLPNSEQNKAKANYTYNPTLPYYPYVTDILEHRLTQKTLKYLNQYDNPTTYDNPNNYVTDTWTYACGCSFGGGISTTTSPNGSVETAWAYTSLTNQNLPLPPALLWKVGLIYKSESGSTMTERLWQTNTPQSPYPADINPYIKTEFTSIKDAAGTLVKTAITDYNYDKNGNLTQRADYDFVDYSIVPRDTEGRPTGVPSGAVPKIVIVNSYNNPTPDASDKTTITANAYNKPGSPNVRTAAASTEVRSEFSPTTALARSEFFYDDVQTTANKIEVRTWDSVKQSSVPASLTAANSTSIFTAYDPYGNISLVTDARNIQTKFEYNPIIVGDSSIANLYITNIRKAFGTTIQLNTTLTYDFLSGLVITSTDDNNVVTTKTTYDDLGRTTLSQEGYSSATNTAQRQTVSQYLDASRTVITRSDLNIVGDGKIVSILHNDQLGRARLARTLETPATEIATEETTGIKVQTRLINTSTNTYKLVSNPYRATTSVTASSEYTMGWSRETLDRNGRAVESQTFDGSGLPARWGTNSNSTGIFAISYDANYTTTTDSAGKIKRTVHNGLGQLVRTDEPDNTNNLGAQTTPVQATSYSYDALGRTTQVIQGVQARSFNYSSLSRLLSTITPEKDGLDTYEFDPNGNMTKHIDARGLYTISTYDELNRVKTIDYSNTAASPDIKKFYDNPAAGKFGKGRYWYDYTGGDATTGQTVEYSSVDGYDIFARPMSATQKFKTSGNWSSPFTTSHLYDLAGNVKEKTLPSLHKITYSFDAIGRLNQMVGNLDGTQRTYSTGITYNASGKMIREQFGTQTPLYHNRHYNNLGQLYDVRLGTNGADEWTWNRGALRLFYGANYAVGNGGTLNNGNVYREDHFIPLNDAITSWFMPVDYYGYDELNRVTGLWEQTYTSTGANNYSTLNQTFSYDRYGNRTVSGSSNVPVSPAFKFVAASNRQKASTDSNTDATTDKMRYDAVGNLIKDTLTQTTSTGTKTYDVNNQMLTAVSSNGMLNSYAYDAAGHRVRRSINNGTSNWWQVYGIGGELVAEYAAGSATNLPSKEYGYRGGELLVIGDVGIGCITRWTVTDQVGTPRILADSTGSLAGISRHDYLPFGEELTAGYGARTNSQGFTGDCVRDKFANYERDAETGLDFAEARYHGSNYGRFTSVDPAMGSAHKSLPQSWNRYSYVMNRPLSLSDPTGEYWIALVSGGYDLHRVPGSKAQASENDKKYWLTQGYVTLDDNSEIWTGSGGTGHFRQFNHSYVRLGADGDLHFATKPIGKGEKMAAAAAVGALALPLAFVIAPAVIPEAALGTAAGYATSGLAVLGTPQGMATVALVGGLGGATAVDVLTDPPPPDEETVELFRGVASDHPAYDAALLGIAIPKGGHDNPQRHNDGENNSIFTSWSTSPVIAREFGTTSWDDGMTTVPGVVLRAVIPKSRTVQANRMQARKEQEVLVIGPVTGASVTHVK